MQTLLKSSLVSAAKLSVRWWKNAWDLAAPPRGTVYLFHGIGEHSKRYDEFATYLTTWGFDVVGFDLPGHGLTARKGGFTRLADFDEMLIEAKDIYRFWFMEGPLASPALRAKPVYFLGHSLGSILLLYWMTRGKMEADVLPGPAKIIVSSPPLELQMHVPAWKERLAEVIRTTLPDLKLGNEISANSLTHDAVKLSEYLHDPWRSSKASPRLYFSLINTMKFIAANTRNVELPTLLISGAEDPIIKRSALVTFYDALGTHKKWMEFQGLRHETLNELGREQVYAEVLKWILN